MQKILTTRGPVTAAGGPQKARASHETDGVCPGSRRTNRFGRSTWASALFSRAIGQRATKETRRALFAVVVWGGSDETQTVIGRWRSPEGANITLERRGVSGVRNELVTAKRGGGLVIPNETFVVTSTE